MPSLTLRERENVVEIGDREGNPWKDVVSSSKTLDPYNIGCADPWDVESNATFGKRRHLDVEVIIILWFKKKKRRILSRHENLREKMKGKKIQRRSRRKEKVKERQ